MIRRDRNILESGKAGGVPLGVEARSNYIEEIFFNTTETIGIPLFRQNCGSSKSTNLIIWNNLLWSTVNPSN
jgi:hypothetical protein